MPTNSETSITNKIRRYTIEDEGDAFQLSLFQGDIQVGGGYFPDDSGFDSFSLALEIGQAFASGFSPPLSPSC